MKFLIAYEGLQSSKDATNADLFKQGEAQGMIRQQKQSGGFNITPLSIQKLIDRYQSAPCVGLTIHEAILRAKKLLGRYDLKQEDLIRASEALGKRLHILLVQNGGQELDSRTEQLIERQTLEWCGVPSTRLTTSDEPSRKEMPS